MLQRLRNIKRKEDSQIIIENLALCFLFSLGSGRDQLVCDEIEGASSAKSLSAIENSALASLLGSPTTDMDVFNSIYRVVLSDSAYLRFTWLLNSRSALCLCPQNNSWSWFLYLTAYHINRLPVFESYRPLRVKRPGCY